MPIFFYLGPFLFWLHSLARSCCWIWFLLLERIDQVKFTCFDPGLQEMVRKDDNCEQYRSLQMAYQVTQRLICLKQSNQGDDYIREALQNLKDGYAAGRLTWEEKYM